MKNIFLLLILAVAITNANATVWQVNNRVINGATVDSDFTTLQAAIDSAAHGDTLYIMGSPTSYGGGVFSKKLTVIGPGYWLEENDSTQAITNHARVESLLFNPGSEGTIIEGLYIDYGVYAAYGLTGWKMIEINADSITIQKNRIKGFAEWGWGDISGHAIFINDSIDNLTIQQNWIFSLWHPLGSYTSATIIDCIYYEGVNSGIEIRNNFIRASNPGMYGEVKSISMAVNDTASEINIYNNVIWGNMTTYNTNQYNNIFVSGSKGGSGDIMMNNIGSSTQYPSTPAALNNLQNVPMDSVFVDYDLYIDNGYILKSNSPAIGAGINGGDCGVFGYHAGGVPYVLSGMPAIPAIYEASVTPNGTNNISVTIKAKSHNATK